MRLKLVIVLFIGFFALLNGQSEDGGTARLLMIKSLGESSEEEQKIMALEEAERLLSENPAEREREKTLEILASLAREGVTSITYEGRAPGMTYGTVRSGAAELLGRYGGEESIGPLVDMLFYDNDPLAIGSAAAAAVRVKGEGKENVLLAFGRILKNTRKVYNNERLIQEVLDAVGYWGESDPEIFESEELMDGLNFCAQGASGYGRNTRNRALELIRTAGLIKNSQ